MSESRIGSRLKQYIQDCLREKNKILLVETRDDDLCENIAIYFANQKRSDEHVEKVVRRFADTFKGVAVSITDFARAVGDIDFEVFEIESQKEEFNKLLQKTKERMEGRK